MEHHATSRVRPVVATVLGLISLSLWVRGWGFYWGPGPHDGESRYPLVVFVAGSVVLIAAAVAWLGARPRRRAVWWWAVSLSGLLLLLTSAWVAFDVLAERWVMSHA
jgi:hypothetical protein